MIQRDKAISICNKFNITLPSDFWNVMRQYVSLLRENSKKARLIAPLEIEKIWERHIIDSLSILLFYEIGDGDAILDYGSGGGLPGIVLAAARKKAHFTLAESVGKKAEFLRMAAKVLELDNVFIFADRVQHIHNKFNLITIRATGPLTKTIPDAIKHILPDGKVAIWAGPKFLSKIEYWNNFCAKRKSTIEVEFYPDRWSETHRLAMAFVVPMKNRKIADK